MASQLEEEARRRGFRFDPRTFKRTLVQLFPYDNALSPVMWRLAIIRDDMDREIDGIMLGYGEDETKIWEHGYFLRRLSVSVLEAKSLIEQDVSKLLKRQARVSRQRADMHAKLKALMKKLSALEKLIAPLRNALGGHVQPNNANPTAEGTETYDVRGLRTHKGWPGSVTMNKASTLGTNYRDFTKMAFLFAWPDIVDGDTFVAFQKRLQPAVTGTTIDLLNAIDGVLFAFWIDIGAVEP